MSWAFRQDELELLSQSLSSSAVRVREKWGCIRIELVSIYNLEPHKLSAHLLNLIIWCRWRRYGQIIDIISSQ